MKKTKNDIKSIFTEMNTDKIRELRLIYKRQINKKQIHTSRRGYCNKSISFKRIDTKKRIEKGFLPLDDDFPERSDK